MFKCYSFSIVESKDEQDSAGPEVDDAKQTTQLSFFLLQALTTKIVEEK